MVPLGLDASKREYWALNPGISEREHAEEILIHGLAEARNNKPGKARDNAEFKRIGMRTEADRREMDRWSWFVAVWGRKPRTVAHEDGDEDERWWGFWKPADIQALAHWIEECSETGQCVMYSVERAF
jgi:hypothetical protein